MHHLEPADHAGEPQPVPATNQWPADLHEYSTSAQRLPQVFLDEAIEHLGEARVVEEYEALVCIAHNAPTKLSPILYYASKYEAWKSLEVVADFFEQHNELAIALFDNMGACLPHHCIALSDFLSLLSEHHPKSVGIHLLRTMDPVILTMFGSEKDIEANQLAASFVALPLAEFGDVYSAVMFKAPFRHAPQKVLKWLSHGLPIGKAFLERSYEEYSHRAHQLFNTLQPCLTDSASEPLLKEGVAALVAETEISSDFIEEHLLECIHLCAHYGRAAAPWIMACGELAFQREHAHPQFFKNVFASFERQDERRSAGAFFAQLDNHLFPFTSLLQTIVDSTARCSADVVKLLTPPRIMNHHEKIEQIVVKRQYAAAEVLEAFFKHVPERGKRDTPLIQTILSCCPTKADKVFEDLPYGVLKTNRADIFAMIKRYGDLFATLCAYEAERREEEESLFAWEKRHRATFVRAIELFGEYAPDYFEALPEDLWSELLEEEADTLGPLAPRIMLREGRAFTDLQTEPEFAHYRDTCRMVREEFFLRGYHRFTSVAARGDDFDLSISLTYPLLRESLANLDPTRKRELPLVLWVSAESDHNGALQTEELPITLESLIRGNKLILGGAHNPNELDRLIRKVAFLHGTRADGSPVKPIDAVVFDAHGNRGGLLLGQTFSAASAEEQSLNRTTSITKHYLTLADEDLIKSWRPLFAKEVYLGLHSCSTAQGGANEQNFFTTLSRLFPEASIDGSRQPCSFSGLALSQKGTILGLKYGSAESDMVMRVRKGSFRRLVASRIDNSWQVEEL